MKRLISLLVTVCAAATFAGCGAMHDYYNMATAKKLKAQPVEDTSTEPEQPVTPSPLFSYGLGNPVTPVNVSDQDLLNDYDGDTIPNTQETTTNPFVAEYPKIVTRIDTPISVEIRSDSTSTSENYSESISGSETKDTLSNSMEDKQYTQANRKTTPIPTKESRSDSSGDSNSYGVSDSTSSSSGGGGGINTPCGGLNASSSDSSSTSHSENGSVSKQLASSTSSETTVFQNVDYVDNLDRSGVEINSSKVKTMTSSFRSSNVAKNTTTIGPNAGIVSSCLHIHNLSVNYPVHVSDVRCTLSFRMPSGQCQAVKTFTLRNEDYSVFSEDVYGGQEKGAYAIVIDGLNTDFIRKALSNGWVPQIHVVSYTTSKVKDSNYNPGVDNLKIVEEKAKGRTALISIKGHGVKDSYRVSAFDVQQDGTFVPGISLKKALFNIMTDRIGAGENWEKDINGRDLTVTDRNLRWMKGGPSEYGYGSNTDGNSWNSFETYVKQYTDDTGRTCRIETIKRLYALKKYNPFDPADNSSYNVSELMSNEEVEQMQFWMIYHDGKYFKGDINDPIWPGERYELVCVNVGDFNQHFRDYAYTPFQSAASAVFTTRWNALSNEGEFARARYMGQIIPNDIIHLTVGLEKTRNLFLGSLDSQRWPGTGVPVIPAYTFASGAVDPTGIPKSFTHAAKGGPNGIIVQIEPSENAIRYEVTVSGPVSKSLTVGYSDLAKNGNTVFIDRNTPTAGGEIVKAGEYAVKVAASGKAYGIDVTTQSSCNSSCRVKVDDPSAMPSGFTISADGYHGQMALCVGNSSNAEYFDGTITGPMNYPGSPDPQRVKLHGGYNYLSVPVPSADAIFSAKQPGLFKIEVTAQNGLSLKPGAVQSASNEMYVSIPYDLYAAQKEASTRPAVSSILEKLGAADLEINFNDGNGWFALQTSGSDADFAGVQKIDCRFTSFIDYKSQVFDIYFAPPAGPSGEYPSSFNVFSGGRTVADVYLRTRAKPWYRDTFWPKKNGSIGLSSGSVTSVADLVRNLLWNGSYDATLIEKRDQCAAAGCDPKLSKPGSKADFFFAPALERSYSIAAELVDSFPGSPAAVPDILSDVKAEPQKNAILVHHITAADKTVEYALYYKNGDTADIDKEDIIGSWRKYDGAPPTSSGDKDPLGVHATIGGLIKNQPYMVAVYGYHDGKFSSKPLIRGPVYPYGPVSSVIPSISVTVQAGARNAIYVSSLYIQGETRYQIDWKKKNASEWNRYDTYVASPTPCTGAVSLLLETLEHLTVYEVRARAVTYTWNDVSITEAGEWSNTVEVKTLEPIGTKPVFTLSVPQTPGNSIVLGGLKADGECRYQVWYKKMYPVSDDNDVSKWNSYDTYGDAAADYGVVTHEFADLDFWARYKFKARSAGVDATAEMMTSPDATASYVGEWSDTAEITTSNSGACAAALSISSGGVSPSAAAGTGYLSVSTLPFALNADISYDVTAYVSYVCSGTYEFYVPNNPVQTLAVGPFSGITTYSLTGRTGPVSSVSVSRGTSDPALETEVSTGNGYRPKTFAEFVIRTTIEGYKFTFHNADSSIPDFTVVNGTTW